MSYIERQKKTNLQDLYAREYIFLAKALTEKHKDTGELALREAIRFFGVKRGKLLRKEHINAGLKINLYNLFTYGDLPGDPRMRRNKIRLNPQERLSETLVCALYDMWVDMDAVALGRIYCEEFHHAKFVAYAPKAQVNLGRTMTQGDDFCDFAIYLRPGNMDMEEKEKSFEEYGESGKTSNEYTTPSYEKGFARLAVFLIDAFFTVSEKHFGEKGIVLIEKTLEAFSRDASNFLESKAELVGLEYNKQYIKCNCPLPLPEDEWWLEMGYELDPNTKDRIYSNFTKPMLRKFAGK